MVNMEAANAYKEFGTQVVKKKIFWYLKNVSVKIELLLKKT